MSDQSIARDDAGTPTPSLGARLSDWLRWILDPNAADRASDGDDPAGATGSDGERDREKLLSDEERIVRQLRQAGRVRQSDLVARLGWSKTKVSRRLTAMEEDGQVSRLRIGREKIVALPDEGFEAAGPSSDAGGDGPDGRRA